MDINMPIIILCFVCLAISVVISNKLNTNIGIPTLLFSIIIYVFIQGNSMSALIKMYPTNIMFMFMVTGLFFGYVATNGTLGKISDWLMYPFRNAGWATPIALFWASAGLCACGADALPTTLLMGSVGFSVQSKAKFNPLLVPAAVMLGANSARSLPWIAQYGVRVGYLEQAGYPLEQAQSIALKSGLMSIFIGFVVFLVVYLILQGYKSQSATKERPEPFTPEQRKTIFLLIIVVACIVIPVILEAIIPNTITGWMKKCLDIQALCVIACFLCKIMKLGDEREVIQTQIPWNVIVLMGGITMIVAIANEAGAASIIASWMSNNIPNRLIPSVMIIIAMTLSLFTGYPTIFPLLLPLCPGLAANGVDTFSCITGVLLCTSLGGISPFSTGGAALLGRCDDEKMREELFNKQFVLAVGICIVCALLPLTGFYSLFGLIKA
ncbi:MAG: hypothetical protein LIO81_09880 [Clostridiales bacterium]|nr:hypothetical protein [Clostridiales bacterium]